MRGCERLTVGAQTRLNLNPPNGAQRTRTGNLTENEQVSRGRTCKPNSVHQISLDVRSFLLARHYCRAPATYPELSPIAGCPGWADAPSRHAPGFRPSRAGSPSRTRPLFGLAPCGVYHAPSITGRAVRSYRTFSPLPRTSRSRVQWRYVFCGTCREPALKPAPRTLSGTLLCGVRTFLQPPHPAWLVGDERHSAVIPPFAAGQRPSGPATNAFIIVPPSVLPGYREAV
jgi:hypothetical protein